MPAKKTPKYDPAEARKLALAEYAREAKKDPNAVALGLSPAAATKKIAEKYGRTSASVAPVVALVFFRENGRRNPLPLPKTRNAKTLASAVRKRRDAGGTLGRWETLAASLAESLGRPVSESAVRSLYAKSGADPLASYVGRGTRVSAPKTREDESAELAA